MYLCVICVLTSCTITIPATVHVATLNQRYTVSHATMMKKIKTKQDVIRGYLKYDFDLQTFRSSLLFEHGSKTFPRRPKIIPKWTVFLVVVYFYHISTATRAYHH